MIDTPLAGKLEDNPFAEVAGQLFRGKKTGILTVASPTKERQLVFYEGHPVAVLSRDPKEHIARFLAAKGKITKEQAEELQQLAETKDALQSSGLLTKELLTWGLKFRFINLSYDLFRWEEGSYSFAEQPPPRDYYLMKVPAPSLLLKGTKHMPAALLMERVPGSYRIGPGSLENADVGALSDEEAAMIRSCREGRLVREVLEENDVEVTRARQLLFAFTSLGLMTLEPEPEEEAAFGEDDDMDLGALPLEGGEEIDLGLESAPEAATEETAGGAPALDMDAPRDEPQETSGEESTGGDAPGLELDPVQEAPAETLGEEAPSDEAPSLELELEPTAAAPEEAPPAAEESGLEIERHSYGEEPAHGETTAGDDTAPPALDIGEAQPLDGPPPLEAPDGEGELPPLDDGLSSPPDEGPGLPPPPWQEQESAASDTSGHGDGGLSPFAPPGSKKTAKPSRRDKETGQAPKAKKESGPLAKVITIIALTAAAAVVGTGIWMGWQTMQSPSTPLEPIPQSPTLTGDERAEGLPISALPTSVKKAVKNSGGKETVPGAELSKPAGPTKAAPVAVPDALSEPAAGRGGSSFYAAGYGAYLAGDLDGAAAAWLSDLKGADGTHTIQVEVACEPNTVKNDMERFGADRQVFAVPFAYNGRSCYRVLLGLFGSEGDAAAVLDNLPSSLKKGLSIRTLKGII